MNNWNKVIEFFNTYQKSTREQFYNFMGIKKRNGYSTIDTYRNNLRSAGFLETVDRGMYKRKKKIPENLTINQCLELISKNNNSIIAEFKKECIKRGKVEKIQDRLEAIQNV